MIAGKKARATIRLVRPRFVPYRETSHLRADSGKKISCKGKLGPRSVLETRKGKKIALKTLLGEGGEGRIYETDLPGFVAKILKPERLTKERVEKLELMVGRGLDWSDPAAKGICWPQGLLLDEKGTIRGYVMPRACGRPLGTCLFVKTEREDCFPHWDRVDLATLCCATLEKIVLLHEANVLIGDINQNNILVEDAEEAFLVDCDSYQVEGYTCPVGTPHFTCPELQGVDLSTVLRTPDHEHFAVASLVFMILMLGKPPYAQRGGESPTENIRRMAFPYPFGKHSRRTAPQGAWKYIWSHFPYRLKQAFFETFDLSCKGKPRRSAEDWLRLMRGYLRSLEKGHASRELIPSDLKKVNPYAQQAYKVPAAKPGKTLTCIDCNQEFELAGGEEEFFDSQGLAIPKRCRRCRLRARVRRPAERIQTR